MKSNPVKNLKTLFDKEVKIKNGLSEKELKTFTSKLPSEIIPDEIGELLKFSSGFEVKGLGEISFTSIESFGFEEFFPYSVELLNDGFGNSWIVDINKNGKWGNIFFVCHDPPVIIKQSEDIAEFISQLEEFLTDKRHSLINKVRDSNFSKPEKAINHDDIIKEFSDFVGENYKVIDFRNAKNGEGFEWGTYMPEKTIRHHEEYIWAVINDELWMVNVRT